MVIRPVLVGDSRGMGRGSERRSIGSTGSLEGGGCLQTKDKCVSQTPLAHKDLCVCVRHGRVSLEKKQETRNNTVALYGRHVDVDIGGPRGCPGVSS